MIRFDQNGLLVRIRNADGAENLVFILSFELFGTVGVGIACFDIAISQADARHQIPCKGFFIDTVAVREGVAVKENITQ
ncbi:MAG: hypothetical protein QG578_1314, partial [Thermodesulfobacteriota bacterium]|nr:hypothetical protein [Thermodesulfobacteriota bacterium]